MNTHSLLDAYSHGLGKCSNNTHTHTCMHAHVRHAHAHAHTYSPKLFMVQNFCENDFHSFLKIYMFFTEKCIA